jgi:hypothetical protein
VKKYGEYVGVAMDVGACGAICLAGRAGNVGSVLAGLVSCSSGFMIDCFCH